MLARRDAVIFDMDGTLLDSVPVVSAVFTAATHRAASSMLTAAGLSGRLAVVVAGDEIAQPKPAPDGLRLARQRLGVSAEQAAYVGDAEVDLGCAGRDRSLGIHAAWGAKPGVRTWSHPVANQPRDVAALVGASHLEGAFPWHS